MSAPLAIGRDALRSAARQLHGSYDARYGGFGKAPKFPPCAALSLLLRHHRNAPDASLLEMITGTLDGMKNGGMYDHLGGGFARYSTDERWLVPHFEKMLYDNAQLASVYLDAYQVTRDPEYARVARETLDYVIREMQEPNGAYFSATDADSEGVEGKFFVWTLDEVLEILGPEAGEHFAAYYDVTPKGQLGRAERAQHAAAARTRRRRARHARAGLARRARALDESSCIRRANCACRRCSTTRS